MSNDNNNNNSSGENFAKNAGEFIARIITNMPIEMFAFEVMGMPKRSIKKSDYPFYERFRRFYIEQCEKDIQKS